MLARCGGAAAGQHVTALAGAGAKNRAGMWLLCRDAGAKNRAGVWLLWRDAGAKNV